MTGDTSGAGLGPPDAENVLRSIISADWPEPFALIHRPERYGDRFEILRGDFRALDGLNDLENEAIATAPGTVGTLALLPFRLVTEKGYQCSDDLAPLLAMDVREHNLIPGSTVVDLLPAEETVIEHGDFDLDDAHYAGLVQTVINEEIGRGVGANFVLRRDWHGVARKWSVRQGLSLFRRLLMNEPSAYWTFFVFTGEDTFLGATPERHVSLRDGTVTMNPISGTYRHPPEGPRLADALAFLEDEKEIDELFMVLDEELKMMGRLCDDGGFVRGPYLKQMSSVSHTEYLIEGRTTRGVADVLRETMWAPTVVGSPLESACRVIRKYEPSGRGYYSGAIVLAGHDLDGKQALDSAILIRTAEISRSGNLRLGVGATLVRHSRPSAEVSETLAKAQAMIDTIRGRKRETNGSAPSPAQPLRLADEPAIRRALDRRNVSLSRFWLTSPSARLDRDSDLAGCRVLVIDAEDTFTSMGRNVLRSLQLDVTVRRFDEPYTVDGYDIVIVGPGPGDPRDLGDPRIEHLYSLVSRLLQAGIPLLAICLGHEVLCALLGLNLVSKTDPAQGRQQKIRYLARDEVVGFYNTYAAHSSENFLSAGERSEWVEVFRETDTGEVFGLYGPRFASMQFHPASVLTLNGRSLLGDAIHSVLRSVQDLTDEKLSNSGG